VGYGDVAFYLLTTLYIIGAANTLLALLTLQHQFNQHANTFAIIFLVFAISRIFYMLAAPIYWCKQVSSANVLVAYKEKRSVSSAITNQLIIAY